jgi:hypothetical protein
VPLWSGSGNDTLGQFLRPFPQYQGIDSTTLENVGQSTYNALQAKVERRFRNGLNLLAAYTYSKTLTDADSPFSVFSGFASNTFGAQNAYNLKAEKAVSYQDVPHAFVLSYLYEFPAGPGKRFFNHGPASKVLGGWQVGAVQRYQTGAPVLINASAKSNPYANGNFRLSQIPGVPLISPDASHYDPFSIQPGGCSENADGTFSNQTYTDAGGNTLVSTNHFFNCAALLDPNADQLVAQRGYAFGNLPIRFSGLRSPTYINEDFSITKRTELAEAKYLTFKMDIPNAFNRHVFGQLDGNIGDGSFGAPGGGSHSVISAPRRIQLTLRYEF